MKIQVVKKATPRAGADAICPYFIDVPLPDREEELMRLDSSGVVGGRPIRA